MTIKPIKKVRRVKYSHINDDDYMRRPRINPLQPRQDTDDAMSYSNRKIMLEGKEVGALIRETAQINPQLLAEIATKLEKFRKNALKKRKKRSFWSRKTVGDYSEEDLGVIYSLCDAYILRISELIKQRYDATKDGLSVVFDENGQFILNGMNIHALVENTRDNPNEKALLFLKGIRTRLDLVLENKSNNRNFDRIHEVVLDLFKEIDEILKN